MIINPYLTSRLTGISWGEAIAILRALEHTLEHLVDAVGGPKALVEDALLIVRDVMAHPGQQPFLTVAIDLMRIIEQAAAHKAAGTPAPGLPAGEPPRS
jgi:hypothetical protein